MTIKPEMLNSEIPHLVIPLHWCLADFIDSVEGQIIVFACCVQFLFTDDMKI